jgi:hypothetical protein
MKRKNRSRSIGFGAAIQKALTGKALSSADCDDTLVVVSTKRKIRIKGVE